MKKVFRSISTMLPFGVVALLTVSMIVARQEKARDDAKNKITMEKIQVHGGQGFIGKKFCFETVFKKNEIRIYPYSANAEPLPAAGLGGGIALQSAKPGHLPKNLVLKPWKSQDGAIREYLCAENDFSKFLKDSFVAHITIVGLRDEGSRETVFDIPFLGLTQEVSYWCAKCEQGYVDPGNCSKCGSALEKKIVAPASEPQKPD